MSDRFVRRRSSPGPNGCPTCNGHFEAFKSPWNSGVYVCAARRRKLCVCANTLALPIAEADDAVLEIIEGEVLGRRYIEELLALVDRGDVDETPRWAAERDRLRAEVNNLVGSLAAGVPAETMAPGIKEGEAQIAILEARLRAPRPPRPEPDVLREATTQRAVTAKRRDGGKHDPRRVGLRRHFARSPPT